MGKPLAVLMVLDTETGGFEPAEASVIEIDAMMVEIYPGSLALGGEFYRRILPDMPVHPKAAAVNGYSAEEWANEPQPEEVWPDFAAWVKEQCHTYDRPMWCGCNPLFDLRFVKSDMTRVNVSVPDGLSYRVIDVQSLCLPLLLSGDVTSLSLSSLRRWAGCEGEQTHSARGDVVDTCQVIHRVLELWETGLRATAHRLASALGGTS